MSRRHNRPSDRWLSVIGAAAWARAWLRWLDVWLVTREITWSHWGGHVCVCVCVCVVVCVEEKKRDWPGWCLVAKSSNSRGGTIISLLTAPQCGCVCVCLLPGYAYTHTHTLTHTYTTHTKTHTARRHPHTHTHTLLYNIGSHALTNWAPLFACVHFFHITSLTKGAYKTYCLSTAHVCVCVRVCVCVCVCVCLDV